MVTHIKLGSVELMAGVTCVRTGKIHDLYHYHIWQPCSVCVCVRTRAERVENGR